MQATKKKWLLPGVAALVVVAAAATVLLVPKKTETAKDEGPKAVAERREDGDIVVYAGGLASDTVSFIRLGGESKIELLARLGDDGKAKVALGTCQSCNGSPGAFYTQEDDHLKCNNCGLTFPLSVLDAPGRGCHPISIDASVLKEEGNDAVLNTEGLLAYERLFERMAAH